MNTIESVFKGKKVLVFGLGRQGGGAGDAAWLKQHGASVRISDRDLSLCSEGQTKEQVKWAEIIVKNPGVPDDHELIIYAKSLDKPVLTSVALFVKYSLIKTIGVTGTRGKSTTVVLITTLLESAYPGQIISGGNIAGTSCLSLFDQLKGKKYAVLELSSFQLHNFHDLHISPNLAVITNLYPDHLNRYKSMDEYRKDKEAICLYQRSSDSCLYNETNPGSVQIAESSRAKRVAYSGLNVSTWETNLPGSHNRENIAAMAAVAKIINLEEGEARAVARYFRGLPFRQERTATIDDITYVNDTTATTPTAAIYALQAASSPTIWITGGDTKNLPFTDLIAEIKINPFLKQIVILGSKNIPDYTTALKETAGDKIIGTSTSMKDAVKLAKDSAKPGDTILLSPGFASFDLFQNEFDRGRQFNEVVRSYAQN